MLWFTPWFMLSIKVFSKRGITTVKLVPSLNMSHYQSYMHYECHFILSNGGSYQITSCVMLLSEDTVLFFAVLKAGRFRVLFLPQAVLPDLGFSVSPQCLLESPVRQTCHNLLAVAAGFWKCSTFLYFYCFFFLHSLTVDCKPVSVSHLVLFYLFVMKMWRFLKERRLLIFLWVCWGTLGYSQ